MSDFLKGNFKVRGDVVDRKADKSEQNVSEALRERVLANICGSMVYVDQTELTWDPEGSDKK